MCYVGTCLKKVSIFKCKNIKEIRDTPEQWEVLCCEDCLSIKSSAAVGCGDEKMDDKAVKQRSFQKVPNVRLSLTTSMYDIFIGL